MSDSIAKSYDELPYESHFNLLSHPDRLASMASLFGLEAPPPARCRVLELGCGVGGNLLCTAQSLPESEFVGIDLSPRQIADGRAMADGLGLKNVTQKAMSLMDVGTDFGEFDYILCHGVYSWVPEAVQARILEIGAQHLAPRGVFYLSYNVYPGWHQRAVAREAMRYHTRHLTDPLERVKRGRQFLDFLAASTIPPNTPYSLALQQEIDLLKKVSDTYVFHEHLEDENRPVYFHELAERAAGVGLQYLSAAWFNLLEASVPPQVRASLDGFADDRIGREQYLDLILNRTFRQSLLCRQSAPVRPSPSAEAIPGLLFTAMSQPESAAPDLVSGQPEPFLTMSGDRVNIDSPRIKAAIVALNALWPRSAGFEALRRESLALLGHRGDEAVADAEADRRQFAEMLLQAVTSTLIEPHVHEPAVATEPGERPRVTPMARQQAGSGVKVVNLRNGFALLRDLDRLIVPMLDGTRDRGALESTLLEMTLGGQIHLRHEGQPITDPDILRPMLEEQVEATLRRLVGEALLLPSV
ncbi:MAG: hypothetical protein ABS79_02475 [Planctomycetes bacterium SCN 63-9]|nr:MAG: hypothetical protein ABS79_02475 [Planctomycetes bacterium SCN 63-9]